MADLIESYETYEARTSAMVGSKKLATNLRVLSGSSKDSASSVLTTTSSIVSNRSVPHKNVNNSGQMTTNLEILIGGPPLKNLESKSLNSQRVDSGRIQHKQLQTFRKKVKEFYLAKSLTLQTVAALLILCLPGNFVTLMVYRELNGLESLPHQR